MNLKLLAMFLPVTALATSVPYTVYNSIPATLSIGEGGGPINGTTYFGFPYSITASQFTPTASGRLTSIDLSLLISGFDFLKTANIDLLLTPLGPGGLPSQTVLTSGMITVTNRQPQLTTFLPSNQVFLETGTPYWLVLAPHDANCLAAWTYSLQFSGYVAFTETPNPSLQDWTLVFADLPPESAGVPEFRVNAIPEPSCLGMALIGLALFVHRRRKSVSKSP